MAAFPEVGKTLHLNNVASRTHGIVRQLREHSFVVGREYTSDCEVDTNIGFGVIPRKLGETLGVCRDLLLTGVDLLLIGVDLLFGGGSLHLVSGNLLLIQLGGLLVASIFWALAWTCCLVGVKPA